MSEKRETRFERVISVSRSEIEEIPPLFADILERMNEEQRREELEWRGWAFGDYNGEDCPKCGRHRMMVCSNGQRRCEKCSWCPDLNDYCPVNNL